MSNINELIDDLKRRINPLYENMPNTESFERRLCVEALESLQAENASLKNKNEGKYGKLRRRIIELINKNTALNDRYKRLEVETMTLGRENHALKARIAGGMSELKLPKANLVYCRHELESIPVDRGYAVIGVSKWNFFCDAFRKTRKQLDVSDNLLQALINALPLLHTGDEIPISYYADKPGVLGEALRAIAKAKGE